MSYEPFYPGGFHDLPDTTTPVSAEFLNTLEAQLASLARAGSPWAPGTWPAGEEREHDGWRWKARRDTAQEPMPASAAPGPRSATTTGTASAASFSVALPLCEAGDLAVVVITGDNQANPVAVASISAGWSVAVATSSQAHAAVAWRVVTEPGAPSLSITFDRAVRGRWVGLAVPNVTSVGAAITATATAGSGAVAAAALPAIGEFDTFLVCAMHGVNVGAITLAPPGELVLDATATNPSTRIVTLAGSSHPSEVTATAGGYKSLVALPLVGQYGPADPDWRRLYRPTEPI